MNTREYVQTIVSRLTDEQIDELVEYIADNFLPEPPNTVHSRAELEAMLAKAEESIQNGRYYTEEEMDDFFGENFGI